MYEGSLLIEGFGRYRKEIIVTLVEGFAKVNQIFLRNEKVPRIYTSNVKWIDEDPSGENPFMNCLEVIKKNGADCKSLVAWRLAELWEDGIEARCVTSTYSTASGYLSHVLIKHPNGFVEDISKQLGMEI